MTFSERERFIYHTATLMTMQHLRALSKSDLQRSLKAVQNNRCTSLTDKQVEEIFLDVEYETSAMIRNAQEKQAKVRTKLINLQVNHQCQMLVLVVIVVDAILVRKRMIQQRQS